MKPGPKPYLDDTEELELSSYLMHCAKVGYGKTRRDVFCIVESATAERGPCVWWMLTMCLVDGGAGS